MLYLTNIWVVVRVCVYVHFYEGDPQIFQVLYKAVDVLHGGLVPSSGTFQDSYRNQKLMHLYLSFIYLHGLVGFYKCKHVVLQL